MKKWLEPPHMTHIVGFCSMWTMPGSCQNLEKSIQVVARADLAPPPVCPLFQSFCFYWISLYLLSDLWPWVISYLSWHVFSFFLSDFLQAEHYQNPQTFIHSSIVSEIYSRTQTCNTDQTWLTHGSTCKQKPILWSTLKISITLVFNQLNNLGLVAAVNHCQVSAP